MTETAVWPARPMVPDKSEINHDFQSWSRSATFSLSLAGWAIDQLLILQEHSEHCERNGFNDYGLSIFLRSSQNYLKKRGLIARCDHDGFQGQYVLTKEGKAVCILLRSAGFSLPPNSGYSNN